MYVYNLHVIILNWPFHCINMHISDMFLSSPAWRIINTYVKCCKMFCVNAPEIIISLHSNYVDLLNKSAVKTINVWSNDCFISQATNYCNAQENKFNFHILISRMISQLICRLHILHRTIIIVDKGCCLSGVHHRFSTSSMSTARNCALLLVAQWLDRWCANLAAQVRILAVSLRLS